MDTFTNDWHVIYQALTDHEPQPGPHALYERLDTILALLLGIELTALLDRRTGHDHGEVIIQDAQTAANLCQQLMRETA